MRRASYWRIFLSARRNFPPFRFFGASSSVSTALKLSIDTEARELEPEKRKESTERERV